MTADNAFNHVQANGMNLQSNTVCLAQKASRSSNSFNNIIWEKLKTGQKNYKHIVRTASFEPKNSMIYHS